MKISIRSLWHIRKRLKDLVKRVWLIRTYCKECGRTCENFHVEDVTWAEIVQPDRELCFRCFQDLALAHGYTVTYWTPAR